MKATKWILEKSKGGAEDARIIKKGKLYNLILLNVLK